MQTHRPDGDSSHNLDHEVEHHSGNHSRHAGKIAVAGAHAHENYRQHQENLGSPDSLNLYSLKPYYQELNGVVKEAIAEGVLPKEYKLPSLRSFKNEVKELRESYEAMRGNGWGPEVVLTPKGLSTEQWNKLLQGHKLADDTTSNGLWRSFDQHESGLRSQAPKFDGLWQMAIMSTGETQLPNMAANGNGVFDYGKEVLSEFHGDSRMPVHLLIARYSPSIDTYLAAHWQRLREGKTPLDVKTGTILKDDLDKFGNQDRLPDAIIGHWEGQFGVVNLQDIPKDRLVNGVGVRPSVIAGQGIVPHNPWKEGSLPYIGKL